MRHFRWSAGSFRSMIYNDAPIQDIARLVFFSMCKALGSLLKADFHLEIPSECSTRSISLCVSPPTSIRGASVSRDIPSRSLHFFLIIFSESKLIIHYLWNIFPGKPVLVHMLAHPHVIVCCLWGLCTKALRLFHGGLPGLSHGGLVWIYDANHADPLSFCKKIHPAISKKLKSVPAGTLPSNMLFSIFLD